MPGLGAETESVHPPSDFVRDIDVRQRGRRFTRAISIRAVAGGHERHRRGELSVIMLHHSENQCTRDV